ncbi:TauD/TfdA family dioxygenase [Candidatus Venteria ishoeyi]|uniref:Taurine catabolism dioxygenase TauD, TfdA family n=1 Tax=Candidatus Venteria ishoeyi TaxID=1899563 RepID=A0A1H6F7M5_9GAMM|nr:TauD/TfdA family dioxygenase [Candidatus Venteria ishoeyi]MDM8547609.1 TauD/TfdA family dioxygenase [Candidatus Venteria ishoeyi]SEH06137.1 Taurine catabolism dioxygenase TauD%2C TfdA family [Candidatus Venteria ishoeyi]
MCATSPSSPFDPDNNALYTQWRAHKLNNYPDKLEDLLVEINDPRELTEAEYQAILQRCRKANMALYAGKTGTDPNKEIPLAVGRRFGLHQLNSNWLADDEGVTSLTVVENGTRQEYIPYTDRPIQWHTDGYYNTADEQIHALLLHCVQNAASGGENALLDHEIAYILLRDKNPDYIRALMKNDVMTIPPRMNGDEVARPEEPGPVFSINPATGNLHMRYTVRKHNIIWTEDPFTREALAYLTDILNSDSPYIFRGTLQPGMGLVSNNVLHDRAGFEDDKDKPRLLYRARYFDRLADCDFEAK